MKVTLGGDRLGSGQKNKLHLHNYERSTHNLSQTWSSSMACGALYPFLVIPAMRGDKFDIELEADCRTIPTRGPLFGSFKLQTDVFQCPVRLYQALLHNNPLALGLKMSQVKLPKIKLETTSTTPELSETSLLRYLGITGLGVPYDSSVTKLTRTINAIPLLAYYDIFKNYYANKQEGKAYVIGNGKEPNNILLDYFTMQQDNYVFWQGESRNEANGIPLEDYTAIDFRNTVTVKAFSTEMERLEIDPTNDYWRTHLWIWMSWGDDGDMKTPSVWGTGSGIDLQYWRTINNSLTSYYNENLHRYVVEFSLPNFAAALSYNDNTLVGFSVRNDMDNDEGPTYNLPYTVNYTEKLRLNEFNLDNIDEMRLELLSMHTLNQSYIIGTDWTTSKGSDASGLPYSQLFKKDDDGIMYNRTPMNGLVVKTYQSDLFNNWIRTEWIDGENGIAAVTAVATTNGKFTIDALNLAEKLYNMLNRVAVSGATYEDWQDAVYTETPRRHIESPLFIGGMSNEVVFDEIIQSAPAGDGILGTLGGRGKMIKRKGGQVHVKCDEPCFIIGITSLTPRIVYTQGNEWYLTDLDSINDFHKPALDGIGFQNLMLEQAAYFGTVIKHNNGTLERKAHGKVPAWINYMTAVDKAFGDFASLEKAGFMVLSRDYEKGQYPGDIKDFTTYIDPSKYNYAFGYSDLVAQNFWVQIRSNVRARRLMSAKQIPNL